jgi:glycosyltransferase involved in cell wall biosynthesis
VIAYIGSFSHYEGLDCLLRALPLIRQSVPEVRLLLVGDGEARPELERLARELRVDGCVRFTGRLPHDVALACYSLADLLVYPRVRTATTMLTTPLKPLEAMAMGKAVLASNLPAMREIVRDGENGILFRAGDVKDLATRATRLLGNPTLRAALGDLGRRFVLRERDWHRVATTYAALYEGLAARASGGVTPDRSAASGGFTPGYASGAPSGRVAPEGQWRLAGGNTPGSPEGRGGNTPGGPAAAGAQRP